MSVDQALAALADLCGVLPRYHDLQGHERTTTPETQRALLSANGVDVSSARAVFDSLARLQHEQQDRWFPEEVIVVSGQPASLPFGLGAVWELRAEVAETPTAHGQPADRITLPALASGVYELTASVSGRTEVTTVLATPRALPSIGKLTGREKLWGINLALYGVRSSRNSGLGDYGDLAEISQVAADSGAGFLGINPLHSMGFANTDAISPYSPSHRGFLNTSYIAVDKVPGGSSPADTGAFQELRDAGTIQHAAQKLAHQSVLATLYQGFVKSGSQVEKTAFTHFKQGGGADLDRFAQFEALSERYGADWRMWPSELVDPPEERRDFHKWLQWVADQQLAAAHHRARQAGMSLGLYLDLAVGPRRDGAESWCEHKAIATGVSIGAPPDHLSPAGQNWNLAAFAPRRLKALRYAPLRRILAHTMRHAGVIRIDHVLGLNRSFWVPDDGSPGGYIRQPFDALLAIIKIEAERNNCAVIGEDLGLVPDNFRETMRDHGFYGYSVMQYEKDAQGAFRPPDDGSRQVLSCFATHDTPTVRGYETGRDIHWWQKLNWIDAESAAALHTERAQQVSDFRQDDDFVAKVHEHLARSNAELVAVQLDDVLDVIEAQNLPGTIDEHPNWRRKYPVSLEDLPKNVGLRATSDVMSKADRAVLQKEECHAD